MDFTLVDRYLLGEPISKQAVLDVILAERSPEPAAAPFYRALEAVGVRAADEAFVALRLIVAGRALTDERVRRVRALAAVARAAAAGDQRGLNSARRRDAAVLADLPADDDPGRVGAAAKSLYEAEFAV